MMKRLRAQITWLIKVVGCIIATTMHVYPALTFEEIEYKIPVQGIVMRTSLQPFGTRLDPHPMTLSAEQIKKLGSHMIFEVIRHADAELVTNIDLSYVDTLSLQMLREITSSTSNIPARIANYKAQDVLTMLIMADYLVIDPKKVVILLARISVHNWCAIYQMLVNERIYPAWVEELESIQHNEFAWRSIKIFRMPNAVPKSIAIMPDGIRVVRGSTNRTIRVLDLDENGVLIQHRRFTLDEDEDCILSIAITPDCKRIVSGSEDGTVHVLDFEDDSLISSITLAAHAAAADSVAISANGKRIVSGSYDTTILVWDLDKTGNWTSIELLRLDIYWIESVAIAPDGKHIVSGSSDKKIRIWDLDKADKWILSGLLIHPNAVLSVAVMRDGKRIAGSSLDEILLWDFNDPGDWQSSKPMKGHSKLVNSLAIAADGKRIISGSEDRTICIWEQESLQDYYKSVCQLSDLDKETSEPLSKRHKNAKNL